MVITVFAIVSGPQFLKFRFASLGRGAMGATHRDLCAAGQENVRRTLRQDEAQAGQL
jgi:hypothetical protein